METLFSLWFSYILTTVKFFYCFHFYEGLLMMPVIVEIKMYAAQNYFF